MPQNTIYLPGGFDPAKPFGNAREQWDDDTRTYTDYRSGTAVARAYTTQENADADARTAGITAATNKRGLEDKVRTAVVTGGTLDTDLGSGTDPAWTGTGATTLRGLKAMTAAQIATVGPDKVLNKLLPILVDMLQAERQVGKLTVQVYEATT